MKSALPPCTARLQPSLTLDSSTSTRASSVPIRRALPLRADAGGLDFDQLVQSLGLPGTKMIPTTHAARSRSSSSVAHATVSSEHNLLTRAIEGPRQGLSGDAAPRHHHRALAVQYRARSGARAGKHWAVVIPAMTSAQKTRAVPVSHSSAALALAAAPTHQFTVRLAREHGTLLRSGWQIPEAEGESQPWHESMGDPCCSPRSVRR